MSEEKNGIKICARHQDYRVPLIWTFAFMGAEYWCPYCGFTGGVFGSGIQVNKTPELIKRKESYEESTKEYLHAQGTTYCSETKWNGKFIKPGDLPQEEKEKLKKIRKEYKYDVKIEGKKLVI